MANKKNITVYTTANCKWCMKTKEFLKSNNVKYTEINISENKKAGEEMIQKSGQPGVPVIDVDGTIIVGYDKSALQKAIGI